ncbi:MAG: hypothetical protein H6654_09885 [Ardenticatenaceae bacterium]|nr:hypothetical protein [Ardenticatenaceae bacterium]
MNPITLIAFHPTGYELHIPVTFEELPTTMRRLAARGYTPSREPVLTAEGLPICPRHGVPMKQRSKQGDLWFSHKLTHPETGETMYCRGYAGASSPGYDLLLPTAVPPESPEKPAAQHTAVSKANGHPNNQQTPTTGKPIHHSGYGRSPNQPPMTTAAPQQDAALNSALFGQRP